MSGLANVAGIQEARDAILEAQIPQTTAIKRSDAKLTVEYDGQPKFERIEGTGMYYSVNTPDSVIRVDNEYYCCHEAVWYMADGPIGPWIISDKVPKVIYTIPPSCPVYNVKYVYVYDSTPDVVYVGYTPGYVGCYVYGGIVVYGTGYHYHGWHGTVYYARPPTWGFAVRYNPHTGNWAFRTGYAGPYGRVAFGSIHVGDVHVHGWGGRGWRPLCARRHRHPRAPEPLSTPRPSRKSAWTAG